MLIQHNLIHRPIIHAFALERLVIPYIGLAKGGSGDVLTGVIASLMAQRADALRAAAVGVWLHGRAGDLAEQELTAYSVTPEDVVRKLPDAIREILE